MDLLHYWFPAGLIRVLAQSMALVVSGLMQVAIPGVPAADVVLRAFERVGYQVVSIPIRQRKLPLPRRFVQVPQTSLAGFHQVLPLRQPARIAQVWVFPVRPVLG